MERYVKASTRTEDIDRDLGAGPKKGHGNERHDPLE